MAWNCCYCSSLAATTSTFVVPGIYSAARSPDSFTISIRKKNVLLQLQYLGKPRVRDFQSNLRARSEASETELKNDPSPPNEIDCIGTGLDVECVVTPTDDLSENLKQVKEESEGTTSDLLELAGTALEWGLLISPFFFWGTAMVAMKEVLPKTGPFFVAAFRLIPAGFLLIGYAASRGRVGLLV